MPLSPGTTLGPYAVTAKIGEGGMGEVYRARDTKLDRDVALKVLPPAFTDDPDRLARFEREAKGTHERPLWAPGMVDRAERPDGHQRGEFRPLARGYGIRPLPELLH